MDKLKQNANEIKTVDGFEEFCLEYARSDWNKMEFTIPLIIENLSNEIDIKNDLKEWEKFLGKLYRYVAPYTSTALDKLHNSYPQYPIECLLELIVYNTGEEYGVYAPLWLEPMIVVADKYSNKIDKALFDKYLMFINDNRNYVTALLVKGNFDIPKDSIYADIDTLLQGRLQYDRQYLYLEDIEKMNINKVSDMGYVTIGSSRYGEDVEESYYDKDGDFISISFERKMLENAIFETEEYKNMQSSFDIYSIGETYSFDDFLLCRWGVVKYLRYLNEYGGMEEYAYLYRKFIIGLIPKALEENNLRALANLKDIMMILDFAIPEDLLTKALINRALWKQTDTFQNILEGMKASAIKCFDEFSTEAPYTGDIGSVYVTFKYKKGFSVWLLLNGYANYESSNEEIVLYEATLGAYEYGHATRSTYALHCASKVLEKNKIACSVGVLLD